MAGLSESGMENWSPIMSPFGQARVRFMKGGFAFHGSCGFRESKKPSKVDVPVTTTDLLATLLDLAGLQYPASDGESLKPLLYNKEFNHGKLRSLIFHYPHYYQTTTPVSAIIKGDLKLLQYYTPQGLEFELFDLLGDPNELKNLAEERAIEASRLHHELTSTLGEMEAKLPRTNSNFRNDKK